MKTKIITSHRTTKTFAIHPAAKSAFEFYSKISHHYFTETKPVKLVTQLSQYQTISLVKNDRKGFVFSGFGSLFFDIENIPTTTTLIEYREISNAEIEYLAWLDAFRAIFSSKKESTGQAELIVLSVRIPERIRQQFFNTNKITVAEISRLSGVQRQTLDRHLKTLKG